MDRRELLRWMSLGAVASASGMTNRMVADGRGWQDSREATGDFLPADADWQDIRDQFRLDPDYIHLAGLFLASHPHSVRAAIERHRDGLDRNPVHYFRANNRRLESRVRDVAARYMETSSGRIALTDSTTMGLGLLYTGLKVRPDQEVLATEYDHMATHNSIRLACEKSGASWRRIPLFDSYADASVDEIVGNLRRQIRSRTRVLAVTWVHSMSGMKLPIAAMGEVVAEANRNRDADDQIIFCVDGVHGYGIENISVETMNCDFLVAGTHKWLFGPRGTGIVLGRRWDDFIATIPTFSGSSTPGAYATPGGFHSFEHRWALAEAFEFHLHIGKSRVQERIHSLATQTKEGLRQMDDITLYTPMSPELSSGIVCFDKSRLRPGTVISRLRDRRIIASTTPYRNRYARLTPGLLNTNEEVDTALSAIRSI